MQVDYTVKEYFRTQDDTLRQQAFRRKMTEYIIFVLRQGCRA